MHVAHADMHTNHLLAHSDHHYCMPLTLISILFTPRPRLCLGLLE